MLGGLLERLRGGRRARIYGHRGVAGTGIENTLAAFELALDQGAAGVELDVRPCASGELVVLHDPDLVRVAGRPELAAELDARALGAVRLPGTDQGVPTLQQAMDLVLGRGARLNVELKGNVPDLPGACAALHAEIRSRSRAERRRILVSSFSQRAMATLRELGGLELGLLFEKDIEVAQLPRGLSAVHPRSDLVDEERLAQWRRRGLAVNTWTVNQAAEAARVAALGVDSIITDDVPVVKAALAGLGS